MKLLFTSALFVSLCSFCACNKGELGAHGISHIGAESAQGSGTENLQEIESLLCELRYELFETKDKEGCEALVKKQHQYYGKRCALGGICADVVSIEQSCDGQGWAFKNGFSKTPCHTDSLQEIENRLCATRNELFETKDRKSCEALVKKQHRYYGKRCALGGICVKAASIEQSCNGQGWIFKDGFSKEKCKQNGAEK